MRFTLHYRGILKANGKPSHKHEIRKVFHRQLKTIWSQPPLSEHAKYLEPGKRNGDYSMQRSMGDFVFAPLVCAHMNCIAELNLTLLRPEAAGNLLTQGGDIDNRMKTLFDSLTMPRHLNAIPDGETQSGDFSPYFFCLLEDDNLVTSLNIRTEQLLEDVSDSSEVEAIIHVRTRVTRVTMGNPNWA